MLEIIKDIQNPILILIILNIIGMVIVIASYKFILRWISSFSAECRDFIENNSGFFTIFFLFLFLMEQVALILIINILFTIPTGLQISVAIFALIVVSSATLEKFIWEYKFQRTKTKLVVTSSQNIDYLHDIKELIDENEKLENRNIVLKEKLKKKR